MALFSCSHWASRICLAKCLHTTVQTMLPRGYPCLAEIIRATVEAHFNKDPTLSAGLLRLHFHDCFVQGCDSSILITGASGESNAFPNLGLRGFEVVDDAKTQLEALCPGAVSCADVLALAAHDAVRVMDQVGQCQQEEETAGSLPKLKPKIYLLLQIPLQFRSSYRPYNFTTSGNADPTINQAFLPQLQAICPKDGDGSKRLALDKDSQFKLDASFFINVRDGNGILESDQRLLGEAATGRIFQNYAGTIRGLLGLRFDLEFPKAMIKMSGIEVKIGAQGEIRKMCSKFK
ncbi:hypothetical protein RHSIM_Rhsim03G0051700 [Rhododendron simsii]|uniref:Peroxidase n=1 Tax=Rhododendron simsii TaxID=118357 RepID=A0A834H7C0_RHOSS|nr:hypothetical protein RHSIM_Rhsim03G0051700 [Rhododendron simsii]